MIGRRLLLAVALCATLAACTAVRAPSRAGGGAMFADADCPSDVEVQVLVEHTCAYLTVPEDRGRPDGSSLQLLVVTFTPSGAVQPDPVLVVGGEVGGVPNYGFLQAYAERLHRVVYVLEQRGTEHSRPSLSCPEVDGPPQRPSTRTRSPSRAFLAAVSLCRTRLVAAGIDPSAFDPVAMAADVRDLRTTLGIDTWTLISSGSSSEIVLEVMRDDPDHVRAAVLDSPWLPPLGGGASAVAATSHVARALFRACGVDPSCRARYPNLPELWRRAIASIDRDPIAAPVGGTEMRVDASLFIRTLRAAMAVDDADLSRFPAIVRQASRGRIHPDLSTLLGITPSVCIGYWLGCGSTSTAVALSALCGTADIRSMNGSGEGEAPPGIVDAFVPDPYAKACARWVPGRSGASAELLAGPAVPVLLFSGALDPFDPPSLTGVLARSLPVSFTIRVPAADHAPMAFDACTLGVSAAWLDHPTAPPPTPPCLTATPLAFATDG
jgi:pimeloyl-ACP methyl ester carboxylesterase